jgi:DNA-binding IclR family transcriptional regulator
VTRSRHPAAVIDNNGEPKTDRQFVAALARGLEILRCFNPTRTELGTMEIAHLTGLPQPTVWRLCHTLTRLGYLAPSGEKLRIGTSVLGLGYAAIATLDMGEIAQAGMQRLADDFNAACSLATPDRLDMLIVRRATAVDSLLIVNLHVGSRLHMANSSIGWAYLAAVPEKTRAGLLRDLARRHGGEWPEMLKRIQSAIQTYEKRGYVLNSGFYHPEINAIAVPVLPKNRGQVLALNLGGPAAYVTLKRLEKEVAPRLIELAEVVASGLASQPPSRHLHPARPR